MASHGAMKEAALVEPRAPKKMPKELEHIRLTPAENGGVSAEHHFTSYEHKPEMHVFAAGQHKELMAHLQKHLGMENPGRAKGTVASPASGEAGENEEE
jgi:hypothetical protein